MGRRSLDPQWEGLGRGTTWFGTETLYKESQRVEGVRRQ